jgi:hypothetical protein
VNLAVGLVVPLERLENKMNAVAASPEIGVHANANTGTEKRHLVPGQGRRFACTRRSQKAAVAAVLLPVALAAALMLTFLTALKLARISGVESVVIRDNDASLRISALGVGWAFAAGGNTGPFSIDLCCIQLQLGAAGVFSQEQNARATGTEAVGVEACVPVGSQWGPSDVHLSGALDAKAAAAAVLAQGFAPTLTAIAHVRLGGWRLLDTTVAVPLPVEQLQAAARAAFGAGIQLVAGSSSTATAGRRLHDGELSGAGVWSAQSIALPSPSLEGVGSVTASLPFPIGNLQLTVSGAIFLVRLMDGAAAAASATSTAGSGGEPVLAAMLPPTFVRIPLSASLADAASLTNQASGAVSAASSSEGLQQRQQQQQQQLTLWTTSDAGVLEALGAAADAAEAGSVPSSVSAAQASDGGSVLSRLTQRISTQWGRFALQSVVRQAFRSFTPAASTDTAPAADAVSVLADFSIAVSGSILAAATTEQPSTTAAPHTADTAAAPRSSSLEAAAAQWRAWATAPTGARDVAVTESAVQALSRVQSARSTAHPGLLLAAAAVAARAAFPQRDAVATDFQSLGGPMLLASVPVSVHSGAVPAASPISQPSAGSFRRRLQAAAPSPLPAGANLTFAGAPPPQGVAVYISAPSVALFGPRLRLTVSAEMSAGGPASAFLLPLRTRLLQALPLNYSEALLVETHIPQPWVPVTLLEKAGGVAECPDVDPAAPAFAACAAGLAPRIRPSSLARRTVCGRFALQLAPGPAAGSVQLSGQLDGAGAGLCLQHLASEYRVNANASAAQDPVAAGTNPEGTNAWMLWYPLLEARGITTAEAAAMALRPGGTVELVALGRGRVALPLALNSRTWVRTLPAVTMYAVEAPPAPVYTMFPANAAAASFDPDTKALAALTWGSSPGAAVNQGYSKQDLLAAYADPYAPSLAAPPVALAAASNGAASVRGLLLAGPCATTGLFHDADGAPSAPSSMALSEYGCAGAALSWDEGSADRVPTDPALLPVRGNHSAVVYRLEPGDANAAMVSAEDPSNAHPQPRAWAFTTSSLQANLPTVQGIVSYAGREGYGPDELSAPGLRARYVEIEVRLRGAEVVVPPEMRVEHLVASLPSAQERLYNGGPLTGAAYACNGIHGSWCSVHSRGDNPDLAWELARNYASKVAASFRDMLLGSGLSPSVFVRDRLARPLQWGGELLAALRGMVPTSDNNDGLGGGLRDGLDRLATCFRDTVPNFLASLTSDVAAASTVTSAFVRTVVAKDGACMLDLLALYTPQEGATVTDYTTWACPAAAGVWNATRDALRLGGEPRPVPNFFASFTGRANEQVAVSLEGGAAGDVPDSAASDATVDLGLALSTIDGWLADAQRSIGIGALRRRVGPGDDGSSGVDQYPYSELATWAVLKASGWDAAPLASSTPAASPSPTPSLSASPSTSASSTASPSSSASASASGGESPDSTTTAAGTAAATATPSATSSLSTGTSPSSTMTPTMTHTPSSSRSRLPIPTVDSDAVSGGAIPTSSPGVARASVSVAFTVSGLPLEALQRAGTAALRPFLLIMRAFALRGLSTTANASTARNGTDSATPASSQLTTSTRGVFVNIRSVTDLASGVAMYFSFDDDVNRPGNYGAAAGGGSRRRMQGTSGVTIETLITVDTDSAVSTGNLVNSVGAVAAAPDLLTSLTGAVAQLAVVANLPADAVTVGAAAVTAAANPVPPSPSPALAPPSAPSEGGINVAAIAGGVGGGVAGIALVAVAVLLVQRRRKTTQPRLRVLSSKAPMRGKGPLPSLNPLSAAVITARFASQETESTPAAPMHFNPMATAGFREGAK